MNRFPLTTLALRFVALFGLCLLGQAAPQRTLNAFAFADDQLHLSLSDGTLTLRAPTPHAIEVLFRPDDTATPFPSFAIAQPDATTPLSFTEFPDFLQLSTPNLTVRIDRQSAQLHFLRNGLPILREERGFNSNRNAVGFRFFMPDGDAPLFGAGSRLPGMDRRGQLLNLYNKASYGYETEADQMYYSLPVVLSTQHFALIFDNGAKGLLDFGRVDPNILEFSAAGGRASYCVVSGDDWPAFMANFTGLTGRQPLPPRWALGNISSRMGYRSQAEVEWVAQGFEVKQLPLDAIVIDLFWFGPDIKGHMGNLDWDPVAFPNPNAMLRRLRDNGIRTILITEPFVLTSSKRFDAVAAQGLLGTHTDGTPYTYDFYFGHTGILDIFKPATRDWFWNIYRDLTQSGVGGWWGDLGEPEVHPDDLQHSLGPANVVHNLYGHEWARLVADGYARDFPHERPLILMRSGFVGSQRFGIIPWSGDVNRSWGGLQSQVTLALQMSLQGLAYMHSDLGGFAGDFFDPELYIRWLQYGAFQPVYRPHAQEFVAPEPIFWDTDTLSAIRPFIELRYAMTPYNYSMAFLNTTTGMPLMRPLFFEAPQDPSLYNRTDAFFWGDAFLVFPITEPDLDFIDVDFPGTSVWFDFFSGQRFSPGATAKIPTDINSLPVFVRAGAFVPMIPPVRSLANYPFDHLILHYYHDASVTHSQSLLYEDDGISPNAHTNGQSESSTLTAHFDPATQRLHLSLQSDGGRFPNRPSTRRIQWRIHHLPSAPTSVTSPLNTPIDFSWNPSDNTLSVISTQSSNNLELLIQL